MCGIPRLGGGQAGERAVTLWSTTPRYPSSGRGPAGVSGRGGGLLSAERRELRVAAACCCCCCGGRSFWPPRLLYTSNKLVHMVVSAKHTARPWRCGRAGESTGESLSADPGGARPAGTPARRSDKTGGGGRGLGLRGRVSTPAARSPGREGTVPGGTAGEAPCASLLSAATASHISWQRTGGARRPATRGTALRRRGQGWACTLGGGPLPSARLLECLASPFWTLGALPRPSSQV